MPVQIQEDYRDTIPNPKAKEKEKQITVTKIKAIECVQLNVIYNGID